MIMQNKTYTLYYLDLNNEIHGIVTSDFSRLREGYYYRRANERIIPMYMIIVDEHGKSYYIPQYQLFDELGLAHEEKLRFLDDMVEREMISPELDNALHQEGIYRGDLDSTEKSILNNLSIYFYKSTITHDYIVRL